MSVMRKVRINLANERELMEAARPGGGGAAAIVRFRTEHGPIRDAAQLRSILRGHPGIDGLDGRVDFAPADSTAPEAPGA